MMRKSISVSAIILAFVCAFVSCVGDDTYTYTASDDAAIITFTLGTFKTASTVKASDGVTDSTVYTSYTGSNYDVCIDQLNHKIYSVDSLPYGSVMKMLATVSSKNSGTVGYQLYTDSPDSATWSYYSSSDTIDFSNKLRFRVISADGTNQQDYEVDIKAHAEESGKYVWCDSTVVPDFKNATVLKGISTSEGLYVLCDNGLYKSTDNGKSWGTPIGTASGKSIVAKGNDVYVLGNSLFLNGNIVNGADLTDLKYLVAATSQKLYAVTNSGDFKESCDGMTWEASPIGKFEERSEIPTEDVCYTIRRSLTNSNIETITVIGNKSNITTEKDDTCAVIWNKTVNIADGSTIDDWTQTESPLAIFNLPCLTDLSSCGYFDEWLLAIGGTPKNSNLPHTAYDMVYVSYNDDDGITWANVEEFTLPVIPGAHALLMSDYREDYFFLVDPATGKVYRGKLNDALWTNK